jgi:hypothetical protein
LGGKEGGRKEEITFAPPKPLAKKAEGFSFFKKFVLK